MKTGGARIEKAEDFFVIVDPYLWKRPKVNDERRGNLNSSMKVVWNLTH